MENHISEKYRLVELVNLLEAFDDGRFIPKFSTGHYSNLSCSIPRSFPINVLRWIPARRGIGWPRSIQRYRRYFVSPKVGRQSLRFNSCACTTRAKRRIQCLFRYFQHPKVFMMISFFDNAVLVVTLASLAASLILLRTLVSRKLETVDAKLFDKSKMKYTDGDNT